MWTRGSLLVDGQRFTYFVKHYDLPSEFGIDGGKISKLLIRLDDEAIVCNYDRGWDIRPTGAAKKAADFLIKQYNQAPRRRRARK